MDTITYTITSFILNFVPERAKSYPKLVAFGTIFFVISMIFSGPVPNILPNDVNIICVGILIGGIGGALINNNCVPALYNILIDERLK